ncbi:NAD(P)H-dependent oxidoreductase [Streptomyces sp. NPDC051940]|uniref:NADPH-dependent FMN reductase n=1 Tax=Streptomyces sp. NPDC051940 TaxID=3155675 RepID=UPI00342FC099
MSRLYVVSASIRSGSSGRPLAHWVADRARRHPAGPDVTLVDLREVGLPLLAEPEHPADGRYVHRSTREWSALVSAADAFVFVMPMHNGAFSAPLKNALDHLYAEWRDKPVGLVSYSVGSSGGAPAVAMLRPVLERLGMRAAGASLSVPGIEDRIGTDGEFTVTPEVADGVGAVLDEVAALLGAGDTAPVGACA